ncbi:FtsX-like permease family protein, partial [Vibrio sp. M260118]|uniref:FtsX-like permease family protein n=1 Tax=Vibrio sp. M260118 TaxID=3020896 RepID=UPI002F3EF69C
LSDKPLPQGWQWQDWRDQRGELFQAVRMEKNMMGLMLGLIIGVAAFNIISALIMVVMEKQSEVAILKTQGMTDRQVLAIFMVQGASSGVIGALIGGSLGVVLASNLNQLLESAGGALFSVGGELPILINPVQICVVVVLAIALSLAATLFPSYRASSVKPAEALRYE